MPRGRHRHEQPLHRLLPPAAVAAAALICAGAAWLVDGTLLLRCLAAGAAVAAVAGAALARGWDRKAGRRVAELQARRASQEWRTEERQAEFEAELEEARNRQAALQKKLAAKHSDLGRLRNEHAALLRRYAHAETQRATALEGRRRLQIEAAAPARALTTGAADHRNASGAPTPLTYLQAREALRHLKLSAERQRRLREAAERTAAEAANAASSPEGGFDFFGASPKPAAADGPTGPAPTSGPATPPVRPTGPAPAVRPTGPAPAVRPTDQPAVRPTGPATGGPPAPRAAAGDVVDLGGDDETLDIAELRGAIS